MELIRKDLMAMFRLTTIMPKAESYLDDDFHQVLLSDDILAVDHLFHDAWQDCALVHLKVDTIELA